MDQDASCVLQALQVSSSCVSPLHVRPNLTAGDGQPPLTPATAPRPTLLNWAIPNLTTGMQHLSTGSQEQLGLQFPRQNHHSVPKQ